MQITWSSNLSPELSLRCGPLRLAWEARGPGLLRGIAARTAEDFLVDEATITPVLPILGGGGDVDVVARGVTIEAMLANGHPNLPEIVRLAWLLARLGEDGNIANPHAYALALVPIVLAAAENVELARCDRATITHALNAWRIVESVDAVRVGAALELWWDAARDATSAWNDKVKTCEQQLAEFSIGGSIS